MFFRACSRLNRIIRRCHVKKVGDICSTSTFFCSPQEFPITIKQELLEVEDIKEEFDVKEEFDIKEEFSIHEDPLQVTPFENLPSTSTQNNVSVKEEPLIQVKKEPSFDSDSVEELRVVSPVNQEQSLPNLHLDSVDLMFLDFARKIQKFKVWPWL